MKAAASSPSLPDPEVEALVLAQAQESVDLKALEREILRGDMTDQVPAALPNFVGYSFFNVNDPFNGKGVHVWKGDITGIKITPRRPQGSDGVFEPGAVVECRIADIPQGWCPARVISSTAPPLMYTIEPINGDFVNSVSDVAPTSLRPRLRRGDRVSYRLFFRNGRKVPKDIERRIVSVDDKNLTYTVELDGSDILFEGVHAHELERVDDTDAGEAKALEDCCCWDVTFVKKSTLWKVCDDTHPDMRRSVGKYAATRYHGRASQTGSGSLVLDVRTAKCDSVGQTLPDGTFGTSDHQLLFLSQDRRTIKSRMPDWEKYVERNDCADATGDGVAGFFFRAPGNIMIDASAAKGGVKKINAVAEAAARNDATHLAHVEEAIAAIGRPGPASSLSRLMVWFDRRFSMPQIVADGMTLRSASRALRADLSTVLAAVRVNGKALQFAEDAIRDDPTAVRAAVRQTPEALAFASKRLQGDREMAFSSLESVSVTDTRQGEGELRRLLRRWHSAGLPHIVELKCNVDALRRQRKDEAGGEKEDESAAGLARPDLVRLPGPKLVLSTLGHDFLCGVAMRLGLRQYRRAWQTGWMLTLERVREMQNLPTGKGGGGASASCCGSMLKHLRHCKALVVRILVFAPYAVTEQQAAANRRRFVDEVRSWRDEERTAKQIV